MSQKAAIPLPLPTEDILETVVNDLLDKMRAYTKDGFISTICADQIDHIRCISRSIKPVNEQDNDRTSFRRHSVSSTATAAPPSSHPPPPSPRPPPASLPAAVAAPSPRPPPTPLLTAATIAVPAAAAPESKAQAPSPPPEQSDSTTRRSSDGGSSTDHPRSSSLVSSSTRTSDSDSVTTIDTSSPGPNPSPPTTTSTNPSTMDPRLSLLQYLHQKTQTFSPVLEMARSCHNTDEDALALNEFTIQNLLARVRVLGPTKDDREFLNHLYSEKEVLWNKVVVWELLEDKQSPG